MELLPAHSHWARYAWALSGLGIVLIIVGGYLYYASNPVTGTAWMQVIDEDGLPSVKTLSLKDLKVSELPADIQGNRGVVEALPSPTDPNQSAYLAWAPTGGMEVYLRSGNAFTELTKDGLRKRDIAWSADGKSIAYATIGSTSPQLRINPDSWAVTRALTSGATIVVGTGTAPFVGTGAETIALTSQGVVTLTTSDAPAVPAIITAIPPHIENALTVNRDGTRIAWVNPTDYSIQVFEKTPANTYAPLLLQTGLTPQSMTFSPDGTKLLLAFYSEAGTKLQILTLPGGQLVDVGMTPGRARVLSWIYE